MNAVLLVALLSIPSAVALPPLESVAVLVDSPKSGCSGTVVDVVPGRTYVLTAQHCSGLDDPDTVTFNNGDVVGVARIVDSHKYDLELLQLKPTHTRVGAYIGFTTTPLTHVSFLGRSGDLIWSYAEGFISGGEMKLKYGPWLQSVIPVACVGCAEGGSGGGMFNERKLIGVYVAGHEDNSMSFMIPASSVVKFLRAAIEEETGK
jgi:hypothetical protein